MNKVLFAGKVSDVGRIFLSVKINEGKLSISGVVGPLASGNARGGCGQIHDDLINAEATGDLSQEQIAELYAVWTRWHLNDMTAGSPDQEAFLRENPIKGNVDHYDRACAALEDAGINPDPNYMHEGAPYKYGHAWLREELPDNVITFLESLPVSSANYAWV